MSKTIDELQLRDDVDEDCNFVVDDGIQSYRVTAIQIFNYIRSKMDVVRTFTANTTVVATDMLILLDPTSADFTQALPAVATFPHITVEFKNIALPSNGNKVTLDANSTELIDDEETLVLNSFPTMDSVRLYNTGTKWIRRP